MSQSYSIFISPHYANDNIDSFKIVKRQLIHHKYARNQVYDQYSMKHQTETGLVITILSFISRGSVTRLNGTHFMMGFKGEECI
jgi:hypothetical protein